MRCGTTGVMLTLSGRYKLGTDVSCENFDGEYVVLNLATGHYFSVSRSGSTLLDGLVRGFDLAEVTDTLAVSQPAARDQIDAFVTQIIGYGIVVPDLETPVLPLATDWHGAAQGASDTILLEVFDDIADLITADPIHEADEATGWPAKKEA